jgi:hypothetical protein
MALAGCRDKSKAQVVSANLSMTSYSKARLSSSLGAETTLEFPVLETFNGDGILIYRSHELGKNADSLREVLAGIQNLQPLRQSPRLVDILEAVPDFKQHEQEVLRRHKPVVVSVDLEGCGVCGAQAHLINESRERLLQQSIDVLEIHVFSPSHP